MTEKEQLLATFKIVKHSTLESLHDLAKNAPTEEEREYFLNLYDLKLAEKQKKIISQKDFVL